MQTPWTPMQLLETSSLEVFVFQTAFPSGEEGAKHHMDIELSTEENFHF